jgi:hypothetical protein
MKNVTRRKRHHQMIEMLEMLIDDMGNLEDIKGSVTITVDYSKQSDHGFDTTISINTSEGLVK